MAKPHANDYITRTLTLLQKTKDGVLMRNEETGRKGWLAKRSIDRADKIDMLPELHMGRYSVVAQRYIFDRAGLL